MPLSTVCKRSQRSPRWAFKLGHATKRRVKPLLGRSQERLARLLRKPCGRFPTRSVWMRPCLISIWAALVRYRTFLLAHRPDR